MMNDAFRRLFPSPETILQTIMNRESSLIRDGEDRQQWTAQQEHELEQALAQAGPSDEEEAEFWAEQERRDRDD